MPDKGYQISGPWQAGLANGANVGIIFGGFANGFLSASFGYKKVVLMSLCLMNCFIFVLFFAPSAPVLLVGQILCGLTWGVFATTAPAYASEVCPLALRGYLTGYVNLCWVIGQLIAAGALYGLLKVDGEWSYRIAYALQWVWPLPLMAIIAFAPESPWWLIRRGKLAEARMSLSKLDDKDEDAHNKTVAQIAYTLRLEDKMQSGSRYWDCFKGVDRRRTEIACMTFAGQILSGCAFSYGPTYFFVQAGISTDNAYQVAVGGTGIAFVGTIIFWFLMSRFGRRTLYVTGIASCASILVLVGVISVASESGTSRWVQAGLCLVWLFIYSMTVGPVCYTIISEISSMHLRAKTVCLSRNVYNMTQIVANVIEPYMINPTEGNWKGKTAFFWAGTAALTTVWAFFRLPECRNRTYAELDIMFHERVSARQFAEYDVDEHDQ